MDNIILQDFLEAQKVLNAFIADKSNITAIEKAATIIAESFKTGAKVLSCGNGGSMSDAMHFAEELTGRFRESRKPYAAIAISDPTHITCTANDYGFEHIFSRYIDAIGQTNDCLLAISTSGNSQNILNAAEIAKKKGMKIIALTGKDGGKLASMADIEIRVAHFNYSDRIQEIHIKIIHSLIHYIEELI